MDTEQIIYLARRVIDIALAIEEKDGEEENDVKRIADSMEWIVERLKNNKLYIGILR